LEDVNECKHIAAGTFKTDKIDFESHCSQLYANMIKAAADMLVNPGMVISKFNLCAVFLGAWQNVILPANVMSGFRKSVVYPLTGMQS